MEQTNGRHELKFYINAADCAQLRARLRAVMRPDEHADVSGGYLVRSLYFDNYADKAVTEKLSGQSRREKFRLRYYDGDCSMVRLEKKSKANRLCCKESAVIPAELCAALLAGDYGVLNNPEVPLFMELYTKLRTQNLRPRNIVEYHREAYTYRPGNVRITFDSGVRMSNSVVNFFNPALVTIPAINGDLTILEIKYDGFLPDIIRDLVQIGMRSQTESSKYVMARLV